MDVTIFSANPSEFEAEFSQIREIVEVLKAAEPATTPVYVLTKAILGDKEIDCLLLTEKGPVILSCNSFQGKISGGETGPWTVITVTEQTVEIPENLFQLSKIQHFTFLRKWRTIRDKHFSKQIPEKQIFHFCNWVYFKPGSEYINDQLDYGKSKWFKVVTGDTLVSSIGKLNHQYRISKTGYDKIIHEFGLGVVPSSTGNPSAAEKELNRSDSPSCIEIQTRSGSVPMFIQKGAIQIVLPSRTKNRTHEFLKALNDAKLSFEVQNYELALKQVDFALKKDYYDQEGQDLKYDILCLLGKEDDAEAYLLKAVKV